MYLNHLPIDMKKSVAMQNPQTLNETTALALRHNTANPTTSTSYDPSINMVQAKKMV